MGIFVQVVKTYSTLCCEDNFQEDWIYFWPPNVTLKTEKVQFLTILNQNVSQGITKYFKETQLNRKIP